MGLKRVPWEYSWRLGTFHRGNLPWWWPWRLGGLLVGKSKGGGRAILKGGKVYRKTQRDFREIPIAYKARKVQVHCGRGFEMARDEAIKVSMGLLKTMQEVCTKSLRQTVTQTVTKNLLHAREWESCLPGIQQQAKATRSLFCAPGGCSQVKEAMPTQKFYCHCGDGDKYGLHWGQRWGLPDCTWSKDRKSFPEVMPELNLKEQSGVSQANQATVKVMWAEKRAWG